MYLRQTTYISLLVLNLRHASGHAAGSRQRQAPLCHQQAPLCHHLSVIRPLLHQLAFMRLDAEGKAQELLHPTQPRQGVRADVK